MTGHPQSAASAGMGCCGLNPENTDDVEERKRQNKANKEIEKQVSRSNEKGLVALPARRMYFEPIWSQYIVN